MAHEKVYVKIDKKTGVVNIEGDGFIGSGCDVLNDLEASLGNIKAREDKQEYHYILPEYLPNQLG